MKILSLLALASFAFVTVPLAFGGFNMPWGEYSEFLGHPSYPPKFFSETVDAGQRRAGQHGSQAIIGGNPAVAYFDAGTEDLKFARNIVADGSGNWTIASVDTAGSVGRYASLAVVNGNPAIAYYDSTNGDLKFARNDAADGSGAWTIITVDSTGDVGQYTFLAIVNGNPAIAYHDATNGDLKLARNNMADGLGTWAITAVDGTGIASATTNSVGTYPSMVMVNGSPAISYFDFTAGDLRFARNSAADGSGSWTYTIVDSTDSVGRYTSLAIVNGTPAISYADTTNGDLKFARNSLIDGNGTWAISSVDGTGILPASSDNVGWYTSQLLVEGNPAISYYDSTNGDLKFARNSAADGSGSWTITTVDAPNSVGFYSSLLIVSGVPAISYYDSTNHDLRFARSSSASGSSTWTAAIVDDGSPVNTGSHTSQKLVADLPAIAYYDESAGDLRFARRSSVELGGTWTTTSVDSTGEVGQYTSLATLASGAPAISYYDATNGNLKFARNSANDGSGTWTITTVDSTGDVGQYTSLTLINGTPAISYYDATNDDLKFARNSAADGSGSWTITSVDGTGVTPASSNNVGQYNSLAALASGHPAISYHDATTSDLKFARNSAVDGSGTWTIASVDTAGFVGQYSSLAIVGGKPAISYRGGTTLFPQTQCLRYASNSAADGSGAWTTTTVDGTGGSGGFTSLALYTFYPRGFDFAAVIPGHPAISYVMHSGELKIARGLLSSSGGPPGWEPASIGGASKYTSLIGLPNGHPAISFYDTANGDLKWGGYIAPKIICIPTGGPDFGVFPVGSSSPKTFTVHSTGEAPLTIASVAIGGVNAGDFTVNTTGMATSLVAFNSGINPPATTFTVTFTPGTLATAARNATLQIASNDPFDNPFVIPLTATGISTEADTDGDGLNDLAEFQYTALGFDWQTGGTAQQALVNTLNNGANAAGHYTSSQVQALNVGTPLLQRNAATGEFTLTLGLEKSTTLLPGSFTPFPMSAPQVLVNGAGKVEFKFTVPHNTAFFRLQAQ